MRHIAIVSFVLLLLALASPLLWSAGIRMKNKVELLWKQADDNNDTPV